MISPTSIGSTEGSIDSNWPTSCLRTPGGTHLPFRPLAMAVGLKDWLAKLLETGTHDIPNQLLSVPNVQESDVVRAVQFQRALGGVALGLRFGLGLRRRGTCRRRGRLRIRVKVRVRGRVRRAPLPRKGCLRRRPSARSSRGCRRAGRSSAPAPPRPAPGPATRRPATARRGPVVSHRGHVRPRLARVQDPALRRSCACA